MGVSVPATALAVLSLAGLAAAGGVTARDLVIQRDDLPAEFPMANGKETPDGGYMALYFRPEVLAAPDLSEGDLLGVISNVDLFADPATADLGFAAKGGITLDAVRDSVGRAHAGAEVLVVQELEAVVEGAGRAVAFRVEYELTGTRVIEYRYRVRAGSAVASLVVSGRAGAGGREPAALARQAQAVAGRQTARLGAARVE